MLAKRLIKSNDAGGGACTNTVDLYNPFPDGGGLALYQLNGDATDVSGNYDGTATNVTYGAGQFGQAGVFNGSNSYVNLPNLGISGSQARTVSLWVKLNSIPPSSVDQLYSQGTNNNNEAFNIQTTTAGKIQVSYAGKEINSSTTLSLNTWYNVIVIYKGGAIETLSNTDIYINGNQETVVNGGGAATGIANTINSDYSLGYRRNISTLFYDGSIDQVRIFNRALRPYEVEALYTEEYCTPTIVPSEHFNTVLYTGNSSTQDVNVGFAPDLVWAKSRDTGTQWHGLYDTIRGVGESLYSNATNAEEYRNNSLTAFNSDGFSVGDWASINLSGDRYVAWNFKAGGAAVTNTDGTITSQVSANTEAGFSIVKYTAGGTANVGHGLDSAPAVIITKNLDISEQWFVYHKDVGTQKFLGLNTTSAAISNSGVYTSITDTTYTNNISSTSRTYINYCFAEVEGFSSFGSYAGTGASGNTIVTGFEPAFVMIKRTDASGNSWEMIDNKRSPENVRDRVLYANLSNAEQQGDTIGYYPTNFLENGFELLQGSNGYNASGASYIYMAFAADPTTVEPTLEDSFNTVTYTGTGTTNPRTDVGFQPDLVWVKGRSTADNHFLNDSVRGAGYTLYSNLTSQETLPSADAAISSFDSNGFTLSSSAGVNRNGSTYVAWNWKGAELPAINSNGSIPSVVSANPAAGFSIVSFNTPSTSQIFSIGHGLGNTPKFIITKERDGTLNWVTYHESAGFGSYLELNTTNAANSGALEVWGTTPPNSSVFEMKSGTSINTSKQAIAYCFAEVAGFSKFGSYVGQGATDVTVDLDFEPAFVMIKSAGESGVWLMYDNKRTQPEPRPIGGLYANNGVAETGWGPDEFYFNPTGFTVSRYNQPDDYDNNNSGITYIYMAFANQF